MDGNREAAAHASVATTPLALMSGRTVLSVRAHTPRRCRGSSLSGLRYGSSALPVDYNTPSAQFGSAVIYLEDNARWYVQWLS
jgi:hypothetical protein